ncbi:hypothetical protein MUK42_32655 [Musa troglodytarum]|uniref:Uncharacterized protein n=1 Tax=Musa troglodytarum TaxID=320322 RepID=A0A9E7FB47_9LILI|nr:hypothetical protein MUK42_32655 [Musa troglodytarum]
MKPSTQALQGDHSSHWCVAKRGKAWHCNVSIAPEALATSPHVNLSSSNTSSSSEKIEPVDNGGSSESRLERKWRATARAGSGERRREQAQAAAVAATAEANREV